MNVRLALLGATGLLMTLTLWMVFFWVPTDAVLGVSQRIFYFHVPIAMIGLAAFGVVTVGSVGYLWRRTERWDNLAYAAAEVGTLFTTLALVTGTLWSRPVWGIWWTWSPLLTLTLVLWLIYVAYLMLRAYAPKGAQGARYAAVLGILGGIDAPIVYMAAKWWRDVHPEAVVGPLAEEGALEEPMAIAFRVALLTFTFLFTYLLLERYALRRDEEAVERLWYSHA